MDGTVVGTDSDAGRCHDASLSERVIAAVAEEEGVEPWELDPPLFEVVAPEPLDELFDSARRGDGDLGLSLAFSYRGYAVTVTDGEVTVAEADAR